MRKQKNLLFVGLFYFLAFIGFTQEANARYEVINILDANISSVSFKDLFKVSKQESRKIFTEAVHNRIGNAEDYYTDSVTISFPSDKQWLRLQFNNDTKLPENSFILITDSKVKGHQVLTADTLKENYYSSYRVKGNEVGITLFAPSIQEYTSNPESFQNYIKESISHIIVDDNVNYDSFTESQCEEEDSRQAYEEDSKNLHLKIGRISGRLCTAWMVGSNVFLTAGHCDLGGTPGVEFKVPANGSDSSSLEDTYLIENGSIDGEFGQAGNDWAIFSLKKNTTTGKLPSEKYEVTPFHLSYKIPERGINNLLIAGYGKDFIPPGDGYEGVNSFSETLQYDIGSFEGLELDYTSGEVYLKHKIDTEKGNSGSPVLLLEDDDANIAIGIHTEGGCKNHTNRATSFQNPRVRNEIKNLAEKLGEKVIFLEDKNDSNILTSLNSTSCSSPPQFPNRELSFGYQRIYGNDVKNLQVRLVEFGYEVGDINSIFEDQTRIAVENFQRENDLTVTGIVNRDTWEKLFADSSSCDFTIADSIDFIPIVPKFIHMDSRTHGSDSPFQVDLAAGLYNIETVGINEGGIYDAWNPWGRESSTCFNVEGCSSVDSRGWMNTYEIQSPNIDVKSIFDELIFTTSYLDLEDVLAHPMKSVKVRIPSNTNSKFLTVGSGLVYVDALSALQESKSIDLDFTLKKSGIVEFSFPDKELSNNSGGISLLLTGWKKISKIQ